MQIFFVGAVMHREKGIAQGAPLSPLLCNVYLASADEIISGFGLDFIRYADDIVFGNALLYSFIATEINKTPLDVRIGFLHATNRRSESLNLDIAEMFKPLIVERTVFTLINKREITTADFRKENNGVYLTEKGKRTFIERFNEKLDTTLMIKDTSLSYRSIIAEEVRKLIRLFKNGEDYKAFRQVR